MLRGWQGSFHTLHKQRKLFGALIPWDLAWVAAHGGQSQSLSLRRFFLRRGQVTEPLQQGEL